jgi:ABC-type bacteriocin/lantibiotic exporter with double-glycine peptidase domain
MNKRKIIIGVAVLMCLPVVGLYLYHGFIGQTDSWGKIVAYFDGAEYLGKTGVIIQKTENDCGPAVLKMILDYYKIPSTSEELRKRLLIRNGTTMLNLQYIARLKGLEAQGWRYAFNDLTKLKLPVIAFVKRKHYVVITGITKNQDIIVLDPEIGKLKYSHKRFNKIWKGETLIFSK